MAFISLRRESEYDKLLFRFFMKIRTLIFLSNNSVVLIVLEWKFYVKMGNEKENHNSREIKCEECHEKVFIFISKSIK